MSENIYSPVMVIGDTLDLAIQWVDADSTPISFEMRTVRFVVRDYDDSTTTYVDVTTGDSPYIRRIGIDVLSAEPAVGLLEITIPSEITQIFPVGTLPYQIQVTDDDNGFRRTILRGYIKTLADIVR